MGMLKDAAVDIDVLCAGLLVQKGAETGRGRSGGIEDFRCDGVALFSRAVGDGGEGGEVSRMKIRPVKYRQQRADRVELKTAQEKSAEQRRDVYKRQRLYCR